MTYTILALDISSKCTGYAVFKDSFLTEIGTITPDFDYHGEKLTVFENSLQKLIDSHNPSVVVIEDIWIGKNVKTFKILSYYHGIVHKNTHQLLDQRAIVLTTSIVRQTLGKKYGVVLIASRKKGKPKPPKDSKELTFDLITKLFNLQHLDYRHHNDITDSIALGQAYIFLREAQDESVADIVKGPVKQKSKIKKKSLTKIPYNGETEI